MRVRMMIDLETPQTEEDIKQVYAKIEDYEAKLAEVFVEGFESEESGIAVVNVNAKAVMK